MLIRLTPARWSSATVTTSSEGPTTTFTGFGATAVPHQNRIGMSACGFAGAGLCGLVFVDEAAEDRSSPDLSASTTTPWEQARQRRQPYPVGGLIPHPFDVTAQYGVLETSW